MPLPAFVRQEDGRLEPFDPDRLYRRLFAAADAAGYADPLAARELADSVLHFVSLESDGFIVAAAELRDRARAVLKGLLHAPIAAALEPGAVGSSSRQAGADCPLPTAAAFAFPPSRPLTVEEAAQPSYRRYGRPLALAEELGLLELDAPGTADRLAARAARLPAPGTGGLEFVEELKASVAGTVAFDAADADAHQQGWSPAGLGSFLREAAWAAALHGLTLELHLGGPDPVWGALAAGPLFGDHVDPADRARRAALRQTLIDAVLASASRLWSGLKLVWRGDEDEPMRRQLLGAARLGLPVEFILGACKQNVPLAVGLSRGQPNLLQIVTMDLMTLWVRQRRPLAADRLLGKVATLSRLAAGAGSRKRERLRQELPGECGWFIEAGHVAVRLEGLADLAAESPAFADPAFARRLTRRVKTTLKEEAALRSLPFATLLETDTAAPRAGVDHLMIAIPYDAEPPADLQQPRRLSWRSWPPGSGSV